MNRIVLELLRELKRLWRRYILLRKPKEWGIGIILTISVVIDALKKLASEDCECKLVDDILEGSGYECKKR